MCVEPHRRGAAAQAILHCTRRAHATLPVSATRLLSYIVLQARSHLRGRYEYSNRGLESQIRCRDLKTAETKTRHKAMANKYVPPHRVRGDSAGDDGAPARPAEHTAAADAPPPSAATAETIHDTISAAEDGWQRDEFEAAVDEEAAERNPGGAGGGGRLSGDGDGDGDEDESARRVRGRRVEHVDVTCDGCEVEPIVGTRWQCIQCEDRDLCGRCHLALCAAKAQGRALQSLASPLYP